MSAADLVATLDESELAGIIRRYGEEPLATKIARKVVRAREIRPIQTTSELAELVLDAYGSRAHSSRLHPATRTFMAIRIAVNDELAALEALLDQVGRGAGDSDDGWLRPGARVGIISFHSLEDRLVKHAFADLERRELATRITRRPVRATEEQVRQNPRARSARFRVIRMGHPGRTPRHHDGEGTTEASTP